MMLTRTQICLLIIVYSSLLVVGCDQIAARLRDSGVEKSFTSRTNTQPDPHINVKIDQANSDSESQFDDGGQNRSGQSIGLGLTHRSSSGNEEHSHNSSEDNSRAGDISSEVSVEILVKDNVTLFEKIKSLSLEGNSKKLD